MYILSDGKHYVMENPMETGGYVRTTSPVQAKEFTYKQARTLMQNRSKKLSWIKGLKMVNKETGLTEKNVPRFSNAGVFCDEKQFSFDESIVNDVKNEISTIIGLAAWNTEQLNTYNEVLNQGLQYYDSALSDIGHARMDKRPPAHIRTKIDGMINEIEEKRRDIKQTKTYIDVLLKAAKEQWDMGKIKVGLSKAQYRPYKGRTNYYGMVEDLLKEY